MPSAEAGTNTRPHLVLIGLGLVAVALAHPTPVRSAELWLAPTIGYSAYDMGTINDQIQRLNPIFRPEFRLEEITGGPSAGVMVGLDFASRWFAAVSAQRWWASSENYNEYDFPANVFGASAGYIIEAAEPTTIGVGAGWGYIQLSDAHIGNPESSIDLSGHGQNIEGWLDLRFRPTEHLRLSIQTGYRHAIVDEMEGSDGQVIRLTNGSPLDLDYSGLFVRLGLRVALYRFDR